MVVYTLAETNTSHLRLGLVSGPQKGKACLLTTIFQMKTISFQGGQLSNLKLYDTSIYFLLQIGKESSYVVILVFRYGVHPHQTPPDIFCSTSPKKHHPIGKKIRLTPWRKGIVGARPGPGDTEGTLGFVQSFQGASIVGGWTNPSESYMKSSNWKSSPIFGVKMKKNELPPARYLFGSYTETLHWGGGDFLPPYSILAHRNWEWEHVTLNTMAFCFGDWTPLCSSAQNMTFQMPGPKNSPPKKNHQNRKALRLRLHWHSFFVGETNWV